MNNLAYSTQDLEKVGSKVEEILRQDLESSSPLIYSVNVPDAPKENMALAFTKALSVAIFGGREKLLCNFLYSISSPRPVDIVINMNKMGVGCHAGSTVFTTTLSKKVDAPVEMEGPKTFGSSKFKGGSSAEKLNSSKELLKLAEKFARTKSDVGGGMKMDRYVKIEPTENGSTLTIATLPRAYSMGMKSTTDAKDFIAIASLMEQVL